jgi:hypothetical protein
MGRLIIQRGWVDNINLYLVRSITSETFFSVRYIYSNTIISGINIKIVRYERLQRMHLELVYVQMLMLVSWGNLRY